MFIFFFKLLKKTNKYHKANQPTPNNYILLYYILLKFSGKQHTISAFKQNIICGTGLSAGLQNTSKYINKMFIFQFFNRFILDFLEFFLQRRVLFFLKKKTKLNKKKYFLQIFKKIKPIYGVRFNKVELLYIMYFSFLLKDCTLFLGYIKKVFESNRIKSHKRFFLSLKKFSKKFSKLFRRLRVRGFFLDLRGKIGVTGNAKKRRLFFRCKRHSLTKKWLRVCLKKGTIRTTTGVLGITAFIFF